MDSGHRLAEGVAYLLDVQMNDVLSEATRFLDVRPQNEAVFLKPGAIEVRFSEMGGGAKYWQEREKS